MTVSKESLFWTYSLLCLTLGLQARDCPPGFERVNKKCYYVSMEKISWFAADRKCRELNSSLLIFDDAKDAQLTTKYLINMGISFIMPLNNFIWTGNNVLGSRLNIILNENGTTDTLSHLMLSLPFNADQYNPNEDCVAFIKLQVFRYSNVPCNWKYYVVCETRVP